MPDADASPIAPPTAPVIVIPPEPAPTDRPTQADLSPPLPITGAWPWVLLGALLACLALAGGTALLRTRRTRVAPHRDDDAHEHFAIGHPAPPPPSPPPPSPPPPSPPPPSPPPPSPPPPAAPVPPSAPIGGEATPTARAHVEIELIPRRAGTNLLSAAVEYTIVVRNAGAAAATGIRLDVRLLSAGKGQDALIAALFTTAIERPIVDPFDLPPETMVDLDGMAMHPKDGLDVMEVAGKTLFVPVLTVNLVYGWDDGGHGQTARSYVIGIDRGGGTKLQPFRLDGVARMYETVGALDYAVTAIG